MFWNGSEAQRNVALPGSTLDGEERTGPAALVLQDHGQPVRYRNIWLQRL